jgi:hypothetical protein
MRVPSTSPSAVVMRDVVPGPLRHDAQTGPDAEARQPAHELEVGLQGSPSRRTSSSRRPPSGSASVSEDDAGAELAGVRGTPELGQAGDRVAVGRLPRDP